MSTQRSGRPTMSVVIPTFNRADALGLQLEALATQVDAPAFEVLVIDNGSTDATADTAAAWADRLDLRLIRATEHQGTSYARNVGIAAARADEIALCDDDDCVGRTWVAAAHRSLADAEFVTGQVTDLDDGAFASVETVRRQVPEPATFEAPHPVPSFTHYPIMMGGNSAIRRSRALALDGFDQRFFPGAEDNDLGLRHQSSGGTLLRAPSMVVAARRRPTTTGALRRSFESGHRHMLLCQVHDLWDLSPHVTGPDFRVDLLRSLGAVVVARMSRHGDWDGATSRLALRWGQTVGWLRYAVARRIPPPRLGVGLEGRA